MIMLLAADPGTCVTVERRCPVLDAELSPGPNCRPFEPHVFQMRLCPPSDGLRARWSGRRWVADPAGRDVRIRVNLLEMTSGQIYLTVFRAQPGAAPCITPLQMADPNRPTFTVGPSDLLGTGDGICLTGTPAEEPPPE